MSKKEYNNRLLQDAAKRGSASEVARLIPISDTYGHHSLALQKAAFHGHTECVKLLIPVSKPKADSSKALFLASQNGHLECVKLLIPHSTVSDNDYESILAATEQGHLECVKTLLDAAPESCKWVILQGAQYNQIQCVQHAITFAQNSDNVDFAMACAAEEGYKEMVHLLFPHCDAQLALQKMAERGYQNTQLIEQLLAEKMHQKLSEEIGEKTTHRSSKKI